MRALISLVLASITSLLPLQAIEKGFDSSISTDFSASKYKTKFEAGSCLMIPVGPKYFVLSPRMTAHLDGNFDLNFGVGIRKTIKADYMFGTHLFYDFSVQKPHVLSQAGVCLELLSSFFDARANYYHPINDLNTFFSGQAQKWLELEGMWKFPYVSVGITPSYNFTSEKFSIKPKVIIPFNICTLEAATTISQNFNEINSHIGISIPLYNMGCRPVSRASSVKHYRCFAEMEKKNLSPNLFQ